MKYAVIIIPLFIVFPSCLYLLILNKPERTYEIKFNAIRDLLQPNQQDRPKSSEAICSNYAHSSAQFHACLSLVFVPSRHVQAAYIDVWNVTDERLYDILHLLEDYCIMGHQRGRGRATPRYCIVLERL